MNRTDRLYALVEELRAIAPRPRSARWLAQHFEVTTRTVERDLDSLKQAGVPIYAIAGRSGGYTLDRQRTLPPLALTPAEALAVSVAIRVSTRSPFAGPARTAAMKVLATLDAPTRTRERELAARVHLMPTDTADVGSVGEAVRLGLDANRVIHVSYIDVAGTTTDREVEPIGLLMGSDGAGNQWYLIGWCRLRQAIRGFRLDRITDAVVRQERARTWIPEALQQELARFDTEAL